MFFKCFPDNKIQRAVRNRTTALQMKCQAAVAKADMITLSVVHVSISLLVTETPG